LAAEVHHATPGGATSATRPASSSRSPGRRWSGGLLRTPEDREPPPVVARAVALHREWQSAGATDVAVVTTLVV
jgi:hypothetical protein